MIKTNTLLKISVAIVCLYPFTASAQFTITQESATNLVQNVLVGQGVQVTNITSGGDPQQIGIFNGGNSVNLGISNGVLMTTGNTVSQSDPNGFNYIGSPASNGTISSSSETCSLRNGSNFLISLSSLHTVIAKLIFIFFLLSYQLFFYPSYCKIRLFL
jgi:hypothetical protein